MSYIYKLSTNYISSELMSLEDIFTLSTIRVTDSSVNIFSGVDTALGLNSGSRRMAFKHNDILFRTETKENSTHSVTFVTRPSMLKGFVVWEDVFDSLEIIQDLLGITITGGSGDISISIDSDTGTLSIGDGLSFSYDGSTLSLNGASEVSSSSVSRSGGGIDISFVPTDLLARLNGDMSGVFKIDFVPDDGTADVTYTEIDVTGGSYRDVPVDIRRDIIEIDRFGHQYFKVGGFNIYTSSSIVWLKDEDPEYLKNDQFAFIVPDDDTDGFAEFSRDRLQSAVNTSNRYVGGLIECSEKTYIGYVKVYSSYVYVDYYYIKTNATEDECAMISGAVEYGRVCRLKISNTKIELQRPSADIEYVGLTEYAQNFAHEVYDKIRFGAGCFSSDYKLYTYRDRRDTLEIIFNRETSSKYIKVTIEDQPTRYRATIEVHSGTKVTTTVKNFGRYSSVPVWNIGNTAEINIPIKQALDSVSDTVETLFTNAAITIDPDTVKILTRTLYVNITDNIVSFPQMNLTYTTLSVVPVVDDTGNIDFIQIIFQPASGAIYGRIQNGSSYTYLDKADLEATLNSINEKYEFTLTCNISELSYTDLDGISRSLPFSNSTMVIAEHVEAAPASFYRVYYKNADSYGYVNAKTYDIKE